MKNFFLPLFIVFFAASIAMAQSEISFGPTIGLNFATYGGKDANQLGSLSSKAGLAIGGFMKYQFADMFALQPEVIYTMKGATSTLNGVNLTFHTNYIEIPVLLKFYIPIAGTTSIKPNLYAGPAFAFNVASDVAASAGGQSQTTDLSNNTKGFDFGLAFGGGVGFIVGTGLLDFSLRYTLGLSTIDNSGANQTITNGVFAINASYAFSIH